MLRNNNYYNNYISKNSNYIDPTPFSSIPNIEEEKNIKKDENSAANNFEIFNDDLIFDTIPSNSDARNTQYNQTVNNDTFSLNKDGISLFGFTLNFDDILIIGIAIFLFMEKKRDYLLLLILALMFLDISVDSFKNINIFKRLFNPT